MIHIRPISGRRTRREDGTLLPAKGEVVNPCKYWDRLILAGDVEVFENIEKTSKPKSNIHIQKEESK